MTAFTGADRRVTRHRLRRRRHWALFAVPALIALLALAGGRAIVAQETAPPPDEELVEELAAIEDQLADIPLMADVEVTEDETWATVRGDFVGARIQLEDADADLTALVERANRSATPVGDAVEDVASAYRTMLEGYTHLETYEETGLTVVVDEDATDLVAEEARGHAEIGLRLLLESLAGFHEGYGVLRDADVAAGHRPLFEGRFAAVEDTARGDGYDARVALSAPATEALVPVSRFEPETAGADPAQSVRYTCVDREAWLVERPEEPVPSLPVPEGEQAQVPFPDCPDLDEEHGAVIVPPG